MVCAKCQKLQKTTQLATPAVKRKSDIYHGSSASSDRSKSSATLGATGISKVSYPWPYLPALSDADLNRLYLSRYNHEIFFPLPLLALRVSSGYFKVS